MDNLAAKVDPNKEYCTSTGSHYEDFSYTKGRFLTENQIKALQANGLLEPGVPQPFPPGTKFDDSCLEKVGPLEPIFILRAQDESAPRTILHWISKNFETCSEEKLRDAFEHALAMKHWHTRKQAD